MKKYSLLLLAAALTLGSCKDSKKEVVEPTPNPGTLNMHFDTRNSPTEDFILNKAFAVANGDSVKLSGLYYFVSNVQLIKADGNVFNEPNSYHLIEVGPSATKEEFLVKDITAGEYTKVRFLVGVDAEHNKSTANAVGDLANNNHMTWDWNTGYVFLNTTGSYKGTGATTYQNFLYEIGKDPCSRWIELTLPAATQIDESHNPKMHLHTYAPVIFGGKNSIDVKAQPYISGEPKDAAISQQVADNFSGMFKIDHVHAH